MLWSVLQVLLAYLSGCCLFGEWLPRRKGIDTVALSPDHNPGAANAFLFGGRRMGIEVLTLDVLKGFLPVYLLCRSHMPDMPVLAAVLAAPVLGHIFPVWHHFHGGKGIAVSFGVLLGLWPNWIPLATLAACYIFFSVVMCIETHLWRSVLTYACFAILIAAEGVSQGVLFGCLVMSIAVAGKHLFERDADEPFSIRFPSGHCLRLGETEEDDEKRC